MKKEIQVLKDNPQMDLSRVAKHLGMDASKLGEIQRDYYKPFLKRDSPLWGKEGDCVVMGRKEVDL